jgi:hypothetical protein
VRLSARTAAAQPRACEDRRRTATTFALKDDFYMTSWHASERMLVLPLLLLAAEPITRDNWEHHPDIEAIRAIVAEVDAALQAGTLAYKMRECDHEQRTMRTDASGIVRFYRWGTGGEDSVQTLEYYYDSAGRLRFLHASGGAVPNAFSQTRLWYDEQGRRIWRMHTDKGEGMYFEPEEMKNFLVRDPKKHYSSKPLEYDGPDACRESNRPGKSPW